METLATILVVTMILGAINSITDIILSLFHKPPIKYGVGYWLLRLTKNN